MFRGRLGFAIALLFVISNQLASAHFLWIVTDNEAAPMNVKVYFGEAAEPDDPSLLTRFQKLEGWSITGWSGEPQKLAFQQKDAALESKLPSTTSPSSLILRHTYGVITRGDETFLLNYYAKAHPSPLPGTWRAVENQDRLPLEIVPRLIGTGNLELVTTWKGAPAAGATITLAVPGSDAIEGVADEMGIYRCEIRQTGRYSIRARHIEAVAGEHAGQKYSSIRHYSTLSLRYVPARLSPVTNLFPELPQATTSFGGAITDDQLYVYGGNYGDAHEYSNEGQSGDLWKLDLKRPAKWDRVMTGPKLQGLAMVAHQGMLYRVGGFTAMNKAGEEQDLRSQASFARFQLDSQKWEPLADLPEPRSSHDVAVLGDTLYVVGGWDLRGRGQSSKWHETAQRANLKAATPNWTPIAPPPFQRRAIALAAWNGKIYCIGGMQENGGTTTAVAIYDPATNAWSDGPSLMGSTMDGFGASAFSVHGNLYVTTMSGSIQRLSLDGSRWEFLGQIAHPRFFHRLLPWQDDRMVIVGGANMSVGKITALEAINVK